MTITSAAPRAHRFQVTDRVYVTLADRAMWRDMPPAAPDARAARDLPPARREEHLAARTLLRALLADVTGASAAPLRIATHGTGQPYLPDLPDLAISVSHDAGHVAAALGMGVDVGVDVQLPVTVSDGMLRRCCLPAVRDDLLRSPGSVRELEFAWIWTVQEACVKALGTGLAGQPWTIPVWRGQRAGRWRGLSWVSLRDCARVPVSVAYRTSPGGTRP